MLRIGLASYLKSSGYQRGQKVLDVGCGKGRNARYFDEGYTGIDIDATAIAEARQKHPTKRFEMMSAAKLELPANEFDLVVSTAVFHHLDDQTLISALREMKRVVKPGGKILITDIVLPTQWQLFARILFAVDKGAIIRTIDGLRKLLDQVDPTPTWFSSGRFLIVGSVVTEYQK